MMAAKNSTIVATVVRVDDGFGPSAEAKTLNGKPYKDEVLWGIPKELGAALNDDVVIVLNHDMTKFISYRLAHSRKVLKLR